MKTIRLCDCCGYSFIPSVNESWLRDLFEEEVRDPMTGRSIFFRGRYPKQTICQACIENPLEVSGEEEDEWGYVRKKYIKRFRLTAPKYEI